MAAASLLVGTLKFDGLLILQARSEGPIPLLMIECSSEREIRGLARYNAEQIAADATLADLMPGGDLTLTVDPTIGQRYQGIVDLDGETLSECFTNYFVMSQQVGTRFKLFADGRRARGMLLQQLPADRLKDEEDRAASWQHITALASTLTADELLSLDNETVLHRLYHEEQVRLFDVQNLRFPLQLLAGTLGQCVGQSGSGRRAGTGGRTRWRNRDRLPVLQPALPVRCGRYCSIVRWRRRRHAVRYPALKRFSAGKFTA